ncbi:hypothetical protein ARMGADRAFT_1065161 [Armillaria gallica]|uniref:Uncharacterized protein n=1 Tax=Armillaria gallica TaxID=47427 RepID=A0A2H3D1V6_ARMGA|nr:hypothetical protein ARMGADRAFT_1065161 [Armillaria gallica]
MYSLELCLQFGSCQGSATSAFTEICGSCGLTSKMHLSVKMSFSEHLLGVYSGISRRWLMLVVPRPHGLFLKSLLRAAAYLGNLKLVAPYCSLVERVVISLVNWIHILLITPTGNLILCSFLVIRSLSVRRHSYLTYFTWRMSPLTVTHMSLKRRPKDLSLAMCRMPRIAIKSLVF